MAHFTADHTLNAFGIGPRTLPDFYDHARFHYVCSCEMVARGYSDSDFVSEFIMTAYREDRENYLSARQIFLGC